ncbi:MAG: isoprenyl transferase [Deltaproteobacteria bacterium]|jgi:undecaprenyl diphosphate synthase|nr:isoprenyl transferase [Deltaproteobacteria bacterium]
MSGSVAPKHVAIIMDGNGRWAKARGLERTEGHKAGAESVKKIVEACIKNGVQYLTLFSFSTENWKRDKHEVSTLMKLLQEALDSELDNLMKNSIRLKAIGDLERLPLPVRIGLQKNISATAQNNKLEVVLALSYGGRDEIVKAVQKIAAQVKNKEIDIADINQELFSKVLWTADMPDPDLLIRTSGEMRISNFLLWQLAYTEIVVCPEYWPDFSEEVFERCLAEFTKRERRFGNA